MPGGYYIALSGMQSRMERLDRLASDIANVSTAGYKTERTGTIEAKRPSFGVALQSAVDVVTGPTKVDTRPGTSTPTGRSMDIALEGSGFFVIDTAAGPRYTRNGHLARREDGVLTTDDGDVLQGAKGPINVGKGEVTVELDGTVRSDAAVVGKLKIVEFGADPKLVREGVSRFRSDSPPIDVEHPSIVAGALEQSNVSIADRMAELTEVSRSYQTLLRAVSVLMNEVDQRAVTELGRR